MEQLFRDARLSDIEALFSVRERTRENAISKEQLAAIGITGESLADGMMELQLGSHIDRVRRALADIAWRFADPIVFQSRAGEVP